jgi:SRSO17 transposase
MSANSVAPGAQAKRFATYLDRLAEAAGHADRALPLKGYCTGLLLDGERKSVEPMAARIAPNEVRQTHQSLHHFVADAPWSDEDLLEAVRSYVLPAMQRGGAIEAWIVDDTGWVKKGSHSVGVARQYCGPVGKRENCQVGVSLSLSTGKTSLPILPATVSAGRVDERWEAKETGRSAGGDPLSNQAGNRAATNPRGHGA